jgi:2-oxo-3-hexenedioate decarboxylase
MALSREAIDKAARLLAAGRTAEGMLSGLPDDCIPQDAADAVAIQDGVNARLRHKAAGYKVGFTSPQALEKAGPLGPMPGLMYAHLTGVSPAKLPRAPFKIALIEAEVSFRMGKDLPPRATDYSQDEVLAAVDSAIAGIEVADSCLANPLGQPMACLIADNGAAAGFVAGPEIADWRNRDLKALAVDLLFDGEKVGEGLPEGARCDEAWALTWTVNHMMRRGVTVKAGDYITTGAAATPKPLGTAREVIARFHGIGDVKVTFES